MADNSPTPLPRGLPRIALDAGQAFLDRDGSTLAASVAFYTALSFSPLVILVLRAAGLVYDRRQVREELLAQVSELVGPAGAEVASAVASQAANAAGSGWAAAAGLAVLVFASTTAFTQLQAALNRLWGIRTLPGRGVRDYIRRRLLSLGLIATLVFLLLVSLLGSALLSVLSQGSGGWWSWVDLAGSWLVIAVLFAGIFRYLPDARIQWRDALVGGAATALLFVAGKELIGLYLGRASVGNAYGAAGSLVAVLLWVYYSCAIFFYGAAFTRVAAEASGRPLTPAGYAVELPSWRVQALRRREED